MASKKTASKKQKEALAQRDKVENIFQFCYVLKEKKTEYKGEEQNRLFQTKVKQAWGKQKCVKVFVLAQPVEKCANGAVH